MNHDLHRSRRQRTFALLLLVSLLAFSLTFMLVVQSEQILSLESLARHREFLIGFVAERPFLASAAFFVLYVATTALSIPGASVLSLSGGFLFGVALATPLVVSGATIGAVIVFSLARTALAATLQARAGDRFVRLAHAFRNDAFAYLLALRLVPLFPFWLVNLVPALLGVRLVPFAAATAIGVLPGALVYTSVGAGLGAILERNEPLAFSLLLEPSLLIPLLGLAALALAPAIWRRLGARTLINE